MEDFFYAGGLPAVIKEMTPHLHKGTITVNGKTLVDNNESAECYNREVITPIEKPVQENAGIAVLYGNLCQDGAVIKPAAATAALMQHRGRAIVFETYEEYHDLIDDPALDIKAEDIIVLKGVGPVGYPGMAEVGNVDLPAKLLADGVKDMVRISDGRMSGTAFGTVVLHVSPESTIGGTLAIVQNGDIIELDVANRKLHLDISDEELAQRKAAWTPPEPHSDRGYLKLYIDHVQQSHLGADLDFLVGNSGSEVKRNVH